MKNNLDFGEILKAIELSDEYILDSQVRKEYSEIISKYYDCLFEKYGTELNLNRSKRVLNCNSRWFFDIHHKYKFMDLTSVNLCGDRFCPNCQKMLQASRLTIFSPFIESAAETHKLLHLVLSLKNVEGKFLAVTVADIIEACTRLIRYLNCEIKIAGIDFKFLKFYAAVRSIETTYNGDDYHPHIHIVLAVDKNFVLVKTQENTYSYDYVDGKRVFKRYFSDLEILIQKLWRLIITRIRCRNIIQQEHERQEKEFLKKFNAKPLTKLETYKLGFSTFQEAIKPDKEYKVKAQKITETDINELEIGYSCVIEEAETKEDYYEIFKYVTKMTAQDGAIMSAAQFDILYNAYKGRKLFQSYGAWYNIKADKIDESILEKFRAFKLYLCNTDEPEKVALKISDIWEKKAGYKIISLKKIKEAAEFLNEFKDDKQMQEAREALKKIDLDKKQIQTQRIIRSAHIINSENVKREYEKTLENHRKLRLSDYVYNKYLYKKQKQQSENIKDEQIKYEDMF